MEAYQTAADYYAGEESHSSANQCLLKVATFATTTKDYKKAIEIYEQARPLRPASRGACRPGRRHTDATRTRTRHTGATPTLAQVAMSSLESTLLKWSVKDYLLRAGCCHLATGETGAATRALEKYSSMDVTFGGTREGQFLASMAQAFDDLDVDTFTDAIRDFDEISRLDAQKTSLLLEAKNLLKASSEDIT